MHGSAVRRTLILGAGSNVTLANTDDSGNITLIVCGELSQLPPCESTTECEDDLFCTEEPTCVTVGETGICDPGGSPCGKNQICNEEIDQCESLAEGLLPKNRYVSFPAPTTATAGGVHTAIRVRLADLDGLSQFDGEARWVGPSASYRDEDTSNQNRMFPAQNRPQPLPLPGGEFKARL